MSLRDEINSVLKTPMQVNEDQKQASINSGRGNAEKDYKYLKLCIVQKAKQGEYIQKDGKKIIITKFVSHNLGVMLNYKPLKSRICAGTKLEEGCEISFADPIEFTAYKEELERLASIDDVSVNIMCEVEGEIDGVIALHRFALTETTKKRITKSELKRPHSPFTYTISQKVCPVLEASIVM